METKKQIRVRKIKTILKNLHELYDTYKKDGIGEFHVSHVIGFMNALEILEECNDPIIDLNVIEDVTVCEHSGIMFNNKGELVDIT